MGTGVVTPDLTDRQRFVNSPVPVTPSCIIKGCIALLRYGFCFFVRNVI